MGLIDRTKIDPRENLLSKEDRAKEVQRETAFIKVRYPNANLDKLVITLSNKEIDGCCGFRAKGQRD